MKKIGTGNEGNWNDMDNGTGPFSYCDEDELKMIGCAKNVLC